MAAVAVAGISLSFAQTVTGCSIGAAPGTTYIGQIVAVVDCVSTVGRTTDTPGQITPGQITVITTGPNTPAPAPTPSPAAVIDFENVVPILSNFDRLALIVPGYSARPPSGTVDGAFRFICGMGQVNYDDPILYPGQRGGSPHLHQWYGNLTGRYDSTYASLRSAGNSTCGNELNRSAYWVPALMNAAGKVIVPDYASIYYKRMATTDPNCTRQAAKGCTGLPPGLRIVSGFDMKRMGEAQPENMTFNFRCISANRPSINRLLVNEAVADCGGEGQIMAALSFGNCWSGKLTSADAHSHVTHASYGYWGYPKCDADHPYVIPELTQQLAYTIKRSDGEIAFSSDRMSGMKMPGGSTFHGDYIAAWDPATQATWEKYCLNEVLSCVDGELGDGTMLKRGENPTLSDPRLVDAPART